MWPYHGSLDPGRTALVACVDRKWRAPVPDSDERDSRLGQIARAVRASGGFVVALTATTGPPVGRRPGSSIIPGYRTDRSLSAGPETALPETTLAVLGPDATLEAGATNGFYSSRLDDVLRANLHRELFLVFFDVQRARSNHAIGAQSVDNLMKEVC